MQKSDKTIKKEAPGVTGRQQVIDKDGRQMNLKDKSTRERKAESGQDTAGSNLPGHQNPGKPKGRKGDLDTGKN
jgi:hypothetical protein